MASSGPAWVSAKSSAYMLLLLLAVSVGLLTVEVRVCLTLSPALGPLFLLLDCLVLSLGGLLPCLIVFCFVMFGCCFLGACSFLKKSNMREDTDLGSGKMKGRSW